MANDTNANRSMRLRLCLCMCLFCMRVSVAVCHCLRDTLLFLFHFIPYYGRARIIFHVIQFNVVVFVSLFYILFHSVRVASFGFGSAKCVTNKVWSVVRLCSKKWRHFEGKKGVEICARNFKTFLSSEIEGYIAVLGKQWCRTNWKEQKKNSGNLF